MREFVIGLVVLFGAPSAVANCIGQFESLGPYQIGQVLLFSGPSGAPAHSEAEYWVVAGPNDQGEYAILPVVFDPSAQQSFDALGKSRVYRFSILADLVLRDGRGWLLVREIYSRQEEVDEALVAYADFNRGRCGSSFDPR